MIKDSGNRTEFESGAVRDIQEGKGRCDLLPLDVVHAFLFGMDIITPPIDEIHRYMESGDVEYLYNALEGFLEGCEWNKETAILELAIHYEEGCKKYGEHNWRKGIPISRYIDSAVRHYLKWLRWDEDERHDRAFMWNIVGAIWTLEHKPELDDIDHAAYAGEED